MASTSKQLRRENSEEVSKPYRLEKVSEKRFKTKAAIDTKYRVKLDPEQWRDQKLKDIHGDLHGMFEDVLEEATQDLEGNDLGRVIVNHPSLDNAVVVPLQPVDHLNADTVMECIEKVLQSHEELSVTEGFDITVGTIQVPKGSGRVRITKIKGENTSITKKRSMIEIVNYDHICMARAILMCWAKIHKMSTDEWKQLTKNSPQTPIVQQILHHRRVPDWYYRNLCNKNRNNQKDFALTLSQMANIPTDRPASLNDIETFEDLLDVNILVVSARLGNKFIKVTDNTDRKNLYLYLVEEGDLQHFHAIANISGFFSSPYFCETCLKAYNNRKEHSCATTCLSCKSDNCLKTDSQMSCRKCHVTCRSQACFQRHQSGGRQHKAPCEKWWKCTVCFKVLNVEDRKPKDHRCGEYKCKSCEKYVLEDHSCYLRATPKLDEEKLPSKFVFFDFECTQDTILQCEEGFRPHEDGTRCQNCNESWCGKTEHVPNFLVAQMACTKCLDKPIKSRCKGCGTRCQICNDEKEPCPQTCGFREKVFSGRDTSQKFGEWLFSEQYKYAKVFAHNMKGYDGYFLLEYIIDQSMRPSKIIYNGSKIMYMEVGRGLGIKVLDSLNFLPMKLAALPDAFELKELKKGYFPHLFNTTENQTYMGPYPGTQYYGCDYMNAEDREKFLKWYESKSGEVFDFKKEMLEYCRSDVDILRQACLKFRELLLNATEQSVDPFDYVTIASVCMGVFRTKFMEETWRLKLEDSTELEATYVNGKYIVNGREIEDSLIIEKEFIKSPIANVPNYRKDQYSKVSIQWLEWMSFKTQTKIRHALNGGEMKLPGTRYRLDGYCQATNTVYEFHGCTYHGCPNCFTQDRDRVKDPRTQQSMDELHALTLRKKAYIQSLGMKYVCIWEHEFHQQIKYDPKMQHFMKSLDVTDRLNPRDSFYGGRTNACKLHYKVKGDEKRKYVDFCSLYPYTNKYCRYPTGSPEMVTSDFKNIDEYFGIAKIKVLAPRKLYHPVLPYRSNAKLKFPLCRTCADTENQSPCTCSEEDRALTGTWCTPEIQEAVRKGYKILKVYEVYHWDETTQYDPTTGEGGLFAQYINTFLKFKQESSGWPAWCITEQDRKSYIEMYFEKEGVKLDWCKIEKNKGLRALAKLCLNSFWGKFGQQLNLRQTEFIHESEAEKFFQILSDPTKDVQNFHIISEDIIQLEWIHKNTFVPEDCKTNVYLATFTTCWARLKLYSILDLVDKRALYYDTDSIIYISRLDAEDPVLGDYLGELTNELDDDDYITEFVSSGPKSYAYRTQTGKETCKVRGFSLNFTNSNLINFDIIKDIVMPTPRVSAIVINPAKVCREKRKRKLFNREEKKKFQMVYTKRVVVSNMDTVPYGY